MSNTRFTTTFLIDSQADISVIKKSSLCQDTFIDTANITNIYGVTSGKVTSYGTLSSTLTFNNHNIDHEFTVVSGDFPIPTDGIIGKDFILKFLCNIDYLSMAFTVRINNKDCPKIPIYIDDFVEDSLTIPPRCEIFHSFCFKNSHKVDQCVEQQELMTGVFVARAIVSCSKPMIRILNTTNKAIHINRILDLKSEDITKFDQIKINSFTSSRRSSDLKRIIKNKLGKYGKFSEKLIELCTKYNDIFKLESDVLTTNNFYTQKLTLNDNKPVFIKNYRMPHSQKAEVANQVNSLLKNNIIEPSVSNYNSPILLVPKKSTNGEKKWRMCLDFRQLNKKLLPDKYPLPRMDDILDKLGRAKWFSTLDLFSGFFQIPLDPESRKYTSFSTEQGSFQYKVVPFGLNVSPNSFSRMMALAFSGLSPATCFIYLDDIIVIGISENHHLKNLESVFKTCRKFNLKLNPDKCEFLKKEVTYLGHKCTDKGILPDSSKFQAITDWPAPTDKDSIKRFVATCNYYRNFVPDIALLARPLNHLTKKRVPFVWSEECQESFTKLKAALVNPQILQYPQFDKEFIITTDASKFGIGAVLSQITDGEDLPIAYASKAFDKGELNKSVIEKEMTAIYFAINHFKPYVFGVKFVVRSDHKPLEYLFSMKDPSSKLSRMRMELAEYDFWIEHIKGSDNVVADALSRIDFKDIKNIPEANAQVLAVTRSMARAIPDNVPNVSNSSILPGVRSATCLNNRDVLKLAPELCFNVSQSGDGLIIECELWLKNKLLTVIKRKGQIDNSNVLLEEIFVLLNEEAVKCDTLEAKIAPDDLVFNLISTRKFKNIAQHHLPDLFIWIMRPILEIRCAVEKRQLIKQYHEDNVMGGHTGVKRTYEKLRSCYSWKGMAKDVSSFVKTCASCKINKPRPFTREELQLTPTPTEPFHTVVIDTVGPLEITERGNRYLITVVCDLSKYLVSIPVPNKEAKTVARAIVHNCFLIYGNPIKIITDLGTEFKNDVMAEVTSLLKIKHSFSTAYHHETLGTVERNHRTFNEYLRAYMKNSRQEWDVHSYYYTFCYNTTPNSSLGYYCPFELVFGRKNSQLNSIIQDIREPIYDLDSYVSELKLILKTAYSRAVEFVETSKLRNANLVSERAVPISLTIGDSVMLRDGARHKLDAIFQADFIITSINGSNVTIRHKNTDKELTVHKNRIVIE